MAVEFPGGRVEHGALPGRTVEVAKQMIATRVRDTSFVLDQLEVLARRLPFGLDLSRVGMFGHSAGGCTAGRRW